MIEDINLKNAEASAILTMVLDEVQGIYNLEEENRNYELNRLKDTLIMSLYMMDERVKEINKIARLIMKTEAQKGES
ncbi:MULTISPECIES: hypothetical protein [unclassified Lactococcus]|uniref:hypothetical protein n=1 Tax=unclassified Lactococcus TaxID=2643510 RepID=UPI00143166C8|nr:MULTISPECIES: hypothetical protein [unclassified Lactococcus]KAF6609479.1 hypothetical protein HFD74_09670 [Lactococcus sp. EKM201L]KAF6612408.1 hypothetical protein HFD15_09325 [Lactococcus sp. EKM203L]KAF6641673.1 hypothetical protein HFC73_07855 [Lactococcus sp. EKM501L]KAF6644604.1 hypothetical protein HFC72_08815 [Lactococcus sp. EKM502L]KAF6652112.1 hypothetical protein HFC74_06710 [Lactococcus sp. EKM101L]